MLSVFSINISKNCGDPRTKEQRKPRRVLECRNGKTRPLSSFPPPCCKVLLSSITCLLSYAIGRRYLPYSSPPPGIRASSNQQMTRKTPIPLLYAGYKSGLRTPVQPQFSPELACYSNSVSCSEKTLLPSHPVSCLEILFQPVHGP